MARAVVDRPGGRPGSQVYGSLLAREKLAAAVGVVADADGSGSWDFSPARLADLRAGRPVDVPVWGLPVGARCGRPGWWRRAAVDTEGVRFYDDDGSGWLAEAGL